MAVPARTIVTNKVLLSNVSVEQLDPLVETTWDNLVTTRNDHSIFHRSAWARVLTEAYGHQPYYLRVSVEGAEAALVPLMEVHSCLTGRRGVSLPFSDFTGPLWSDLRQASSVYQALAKFSSEREWKHLEIRGGAAPPIGAKPFQTYHTHQLDLRQGLESIGKRLESSVRNDIRKAERSGIEVTVNRSPQAMEDYYTLHSRTRRRHGLPPQPIAFFNAITRNLIEQNLGEIVLAKLGGNPVAGAVFLHSGGQVIYKFGASDTEHWRLRPNHYVMWNAIQHFVSKGFREIHFGRTPQIDHGLSRFKRSWGCASGLLPYFRRSCRGATWEHSNHPHLERHPMIFRFFPIRLNQFAGRLIYPHLD